MSKKKVLATFLFTTRLRIKISTRKFYQRSPYKRWIYGGIFIIISLIEQKSWNRMCGLCFFGICQQIYIELMSSILWYLIYQNEIFTIDSTLSEVPSEKILHQYLYWRRIVSQKGGKNSSVFRYYASQSHNRTSDVTISMLLKI